MGVQCHVGYVDRPTHPGHISTAETSQSSWLGNNITDLLNPDLVFLVTISPYGNHSTTPVRIRITLGYCDYCVPSILVVERPINDYLCFERQRWRLHWSKKLAAELFLLIWIPWVFRRPMINFLSMQLNSHVELFFLGNRCFTSTIQSDYLETKSTLAIQGVFRFARHQRQQEANTKRK